MVEVGVKEEETVDAHEQEGVEHVVHDNNHFESYKDEQNGEQDGHEQKWSPGLRYDASDDVEESDAEVCRSSCVPNAWQS